MRGRIMHQSCAWSDIAGRAVLMCVAEVHDALNKARHVCERARVGERPVS